MLRLNGVVEAFWEDWGNACLSWFLTPDVLHAWCKFFFDHCVHWVINIMGREELDHCLSVLQPHVGQIGLMAFPSSSRLEVRTIGKLRGY